MDILNETPFPTELVVGAGPGGQPVVALVVKATFALPARAGQVAELALEQLPISTTDEFYDDDVTGSIRLESDLVPYKPHADVVLVGKAYAPKGYPVRALDVQLRVGRLSKTVRVIGDRVWLFPSKLVMVPVMSEPQPFLEMPLRYERAFGGIDHAGGKWCAENLVGCGFIGKKSRDSVDAKPLPNLEDPRFLINSWDDQPKPVGFGFVNRGWKPRIQFVGTVDERVQPNPNTGLPVDFSTDFYNGAHPDLQVSGYLQGNEEVEMLNLSQDGYRRFRLPGIRPVVTFHRYASVPAPEEALTATNEEGVEDVMLQEQPAHDEEVRAPLDTLVFLPDQEIFYQVWRGLYPLQDASLEEIAVINIRTAKT